MAKKASIPTPVILAEPRPGTTPVANRIARNAAGERIQAMSDGAWVSVR